MDLSFSTHIYPKEIIKHIYLGQIMLAIHMHVMDLKKWLLKSGFCKCLLKINLFHLGIIVN